MTSLRNFIFSVSSVLSVVQSSRKTTIKCIDLGNQNISNGAYLQT
jgi:hypothetical protein